MATTMTREELERFKRKLEETRRRVASDPKEAVRVLQAAGILTETGELAPPYREPAKP